MDNLIFDADTPHDMMSASKSVASLLVGIAVDRGLIKNINAPIFDFFPELSDCVPLKWNASSYCMRSRCRWV